MSRQYALRLVSVLCLLSALVVRIAAQESLLASIAVTPKPLVCTLLGTGKVTCTSLSESPRYVALKSNNSYVILPEYVEVPPGSLTAEFPVQPLNVDVNQRVVITASLSGSVSHVVLMVKPPTVGAITSDAASTVGGSRIRAYVKLDGPAPVGGRQVKLSSDSPLATPNTDLVVIPEGQRMATVEVTTSTVENAQGATIYAADGYVTRAKRIILRKVPLPPWWSLIATNPNRQSANIGFPRNTVAPGAYDAVSYRSRHVAATQGTIIRHVRLIYANYIGERGFGEQPGKNPITVKGALEYLSANGSAAQDMPIQPVTFNGQSTVMIPPGDYKISDPLSFDLADGQTFFVRSTQIVADPTHSVCSGPSTLDPMELGGDTGEGIAAGDYAFGGIIPQVSRRFTFGPVAIVAYCEKPLATMAILGDSIVAGLEDLGYRYEAGGYAERAATRNFEPAQRLDESPYCGYINLSRGGEKTISGLCSTLRFELSTLAPTVLVNYACNDVNLYDPVSNSEDIIKANMIALIRRWTDLGKRVIVTTGTPRTYSTDGFLTLENQRPRDYEDVRLRLNQWLRNPEGFIADLGESAANVVVWDIAALVSANREGQIDPEGAFWLSRIQPFDQGSVTPATTKINNASWSDTSKTWAVNALRAKWAIFTSGTCIGQYRFIRYNNSEGKITSRNFRYVPKVGDTFEVFTGLLTPDGAHMISEAHALVASNFNYSWLDPVSETP